MQASVVGSFDPQLSYRGYVQQRCSAERSGLGESRVPEKGSCNVPTTVRARGTVDAEVAVNDERVPSADSFQLGDGVAIQTTPGVGGPRAVWKPARHADPAL
ncbi:uncharacterized protein LOC143209933 [Lasioglossum baleicum]|uniref:uncharacterized protein LOC143209933 n=1 Tax=Lasioglossum baleicum TaxID=434251 RepID=UPI003FCE0C5E